MKILMQWVQCQAGWMAIGQGEPHPASHRAVALEPLQLLTYLLMLHLLEPSFSIESMSQILPA
jgi:hypothetical protein